VATPAATTPLPVAAPTVLSTVPVASTSVSFEYIPTSNTDIAGNDMVGMSALAKTSVECQTLCNTLPDCQGYIYVGDAYTGSAVNKNKCWLKKDVDTLNKSVTGITKYKKKPVSSSPVPVQSPSTVAAAPVTTTSGFSFEYVATNYTDIAGNTITGQSALAKTPVECQTLCNTLPDCQGYIYVGDAYTGSATNKNKCWLKKDVDTLNTSVTGITKYKKVQTKSNLIYTPTPNTDIAGNDITGLGALSKSVTDCQTLCNSTANCQGFIYVGDAYTGSAANKNKCWLKKDVDTLNKNVTGITKYKKTSP
jgi:hypothetical protein